MTLAVSQQHLQVKSVATMTEFVKLCNGSTFITSNCAHATKDHEFETPQTVSDYGLNVSFIDGS